MSHKGKDGQVYKSRSCEVLGREGIKKRVNTQESVIRGRGIGLNVETQRSLVYQQLMRGIDS